VEEVSGMAEDSGSYRVHVRVHVYALHMPQESLVDVRLVQQKVSSLHQAKQKK